MSELEYGSVINGLTCLVYGLIIILENAFQHMAQIREDGEDLESMS